MNRNKFEESRNVMNGGRPAWIAALLSAAVALGGYPAGALASTRSEKQPEPDEVVHFDLRPNPQFLRCLAQFPDDAQRPLHGCLRVLSRRLLRRCPPPRCGRGGGAADGAWGELPGRLRPRVLRACGGMAHLQEDRAARARHGRCTALVKARYGVTRGMTRTVRACGRRSSPSPRPHRAVVGTTSGKGRT
jgi:hypothetical protein